MALAATTPGPFAVLARWQAAQQRVYVVTRHAAGVRGRAVGTLVGFDRFLNLLLRDVEEHYTVIVKVQRTKQQQQDVQQDVQQQHQLNAPPGQQQQPVQASGPPEQQPHDLPQQQQQQPAGQRHDRQAASDGSSSSSRPATTRTRTRWCRKQEHRFRQLDQILLRGDSVVLVSGTLPGPGRMAAAGAAAAAAAMSGRPGPAQAL
jgi:small nuclear ribonucleoprotein (snRNP)-like protein